MKRKSAVILTGIMLLFASSNVFASDLERFQPYTEVDLSIFDDAGWTCTVDEWNFTAEVEPVKQIKKIEGDGSYKDSYSIKMDLKLVYSTGTCQVVPRLIFERSGMLTYFDDRMTNVYIRNGENRYRIDTRGCSRSSSAKTSTATDTSVEAMSLTGIPILEDLANSKYPIQVKIGDFASTIDLTESDQDAIKEFYDTCEKAGIFDQLYLQIIEDDYEAITIFNEDSPDLEETKQDEEEPGEGESTEGESDENAVDDTGNSVADLLG